jgi:hypothetical protein
MRRALYRGTADRADLVWRAQGTSGPDNGWTPQLDEVFFRKLVWDGAVLAAAGRAPPLPHDDAHRSGDQSAPALAAAPLGP